MPLPVPGAGLKIVSHNPYPNRPTLVFLHDSLGCITLWRDFPEKLARLTSCNLLIYDREGYGQSAPFREPNRNNQYLEREADVLHELLAQFRITEAILFGHSDGGSIALIAAAKFPNHIRGIITEGAHIFVEDLTLKGIKVASELYHTTNLKSKLEKYHGTKTEAMFQAWANTWTTKEFRSWKIEHFLPRITCPVLVIQGEEDEYGTLAQVEGIAANVSGKAEKLIIPQAGHTPHKEAPELVLAEAARFIKEITGE